MFTNLNLPSLQTISGNFSLNGLGSLTTLTLPMLQTVNSFSLNGLTSFTNLNLPSLQTINGNFYLSGLTSFTNLTLPSLQTLLGNISTSQEPSQGLNLTNISFPELPSCTNFRVSQWPENNLFIGPGSINIINYYFGVSINLSSLATCNYMGIYAASNLNLSSLANCADLSIGGSSLTSLSLPLLNNNTFLELSGCALNSNSINSLLNQFLTVLPSSGKTIKLNLQQPPAPPTGQGIIDKQTLINSGNAVYTD